MRDFLRNNKLAVITIAITLVLGLVAILTAVRFYQLRRQAVAPTAPEQPEAAVPTPTAGPGPSLPPPAASCSLSFVASSPTPTPTNKPTPTLTNTPTPTPTKT